MKNNKFVYLSYPINGNEDIVFEHANKMKKFAKELGLIPVSPLDLNKQTPDNIHKTRHKANEFLGNDIKHLLLCDNILMGKGWENSKGCKLEYYAALLYNIKIFFE